VDPHRPRKPRAAPLHSRSRVEGVVDRSRPLGPTCNFSGRISSLRATRVLNTSHASARVPDCLTTALGISHWLHRHAGKPSSCSNLPPKSLVAPVSTRARPRAVPNASPSSVLWRRRACWRAGPLRGAAEPKGSGVGPSVGETRGTAPLATHAADRPRLTVVTQVVTRTTVNRRARGGSRRLPVNCRRW